MPSWCPSVMRRGQGAVDISDDGHNVAIRVAELIERMKSMRNRRRVATVTCVSRMSSAVCDQYECYSSSISCMRMPIARSIPNGTTVNKIYIAHSAPCPATSPVVTDSAPTEEAELSHTMPRRGSAHRPNRQDGQGNPLPLRVPRSSCASAYAYQSHNRHTLDSALGPGPTCTTDYYAN